MQEDDCLAGNVPLRPNKDMDHERPFTLSFIIIFVPQNGGYLALNRSIGCKEAVIIPNLVA